MPLSRRKGFIKRLQREKGFGFIRDESGQEYFFHRSALIGMAWDHLNEGMSMSFEPTRSDKGPRAENVRAE